MPEYEVRFTRSARKELEALDSRVVDRVFPRVEALAIDPRPSGCRKLQGSSNLWRIRIGDYRVLYAVLDDVRVIDVIAVRHRREAYQ